MGRGTVVVAAGGGGGVGWFWDPGFHSDFPWHRRALLSGERDAQIQQLQDDRRAAEAAAFEARNLATQAAADAPEAPLIPYTD